MEKTGQCLCGAVRFRARLGEAHMHACHCGMCRRWAGGPVLAAPVEAVTFEEDSALRRYASSGWAERGFCGNCGSHLFFHLKEAGRYVVSFGAFDDAADFRLASEIFIDFKPAGYVLGGDHPRLTEAQFLAQFGLSADTP